MHVIKQYSLPFLLALVLHVGAAWSLYQNWDKQTKVSDFVKPETVMANLIVMQPKSKPKVDLAAQQQAQNLQAARAREKKAQEEALAAKRKQEELEKQRQQKAEELKAEELKQLQEEAAHKQAEEQALQERLQRLAELADSSFDQALAAESQALEASDDELIAQSFKAGIRQKIMANWSRPPSARNGMKATLVIELIPTGEVVSVTITQSSGNTAFDRSAERAVRGAGRFEVPSENSIFEAHFRQVYLLFQPEDLLR